MSDRDKVPSLVCICGAVGSGNTFMFNCLTQDENTFGVNEDALGSTLRRLIDSEKEMGKCPHSVEAFKSFIDALRGSRRTLILKTPSNLRHANLLLTHFPNTHFVTMVREPHAAITSGIARHEADASIETNANRWLKDCADLQNVNGPSTVVAFEDLAADPEKVLQKLSQEVMPLSDSAFKYAKRMHRPERAGADRWKSKVDESTASEIEQWVAELSLVDCYRSVTGAESIAVGPLLGTDPKTNRSVISRSLTMLKKQFFRVRYRLLK